MRGEAAVGVDAARLLDNTDALKSECLHLLGLLRRNPACDVGEGAPTGEPLRDASRIRSEHARQGLCRSGRILEPARYGEDARRLDRDRELLAPAIEDLAALGRQQDRRLYLALAVLGTAMIE